MIAPLGLEAVGNGIPLGRLLGGCIREVETDAPRPTIPRGQGPFLDN